jgi:predicted amidohydrolase YtcJ
MLEPYEGEPDNLGINTTPIEKIRESALRANRAGLATAIHAIGDRAVRETLDIYAHIRKELGDTGLRNRIEHVQLIDPQDACRLAELRIIASMQPIHATSDYLMADRYWGKRARWSYAWKTQLNCGAVLALGSDCPVEPLNPLLGIHAAVTRRRVDGSPSEEGWYPDERLTVEEAVRGFTQGPAYAAGMEDRLGKIAVGFLADATVVDRDIFEIDPMEIANVKVVKTIVGGKEQL